MGHMNVSGHGRIIGKNIVITNLAIMGHMNIGHDQIATTDSGYTFILNRSTVNGAALTEVVVVADFQAGGFTFVLFILTILTNGSKLENTITFADFGRTFDAGMGMNDSTGVDGHARTDIGERANLHIRGQLSFWINNSLWMDQLQIPFSTGYIRYSNFLTINRRHCMEFPNSAFTGLNGSPNRQLFTGSH